MIAKTTLCLIVITTTCQTAIQFARGDDCCNCCQNTDHSYIRQSTRLSALIIHLSRRVYNSSFENLEEAQRGDTKNVNIQIRKSYSNIRTEYKYSNIQTFIDILSFYHGGHLGHVTSIILQYFHFHICKSLHTKKWLITAKWFLRKACLIFICKWPWAKVKK